jgi:hypothetical protein
MKRLDWSRRHTLHNTRVVSGESKPNGRNLDMDLVGEIDASQELEEGPG